MKATLVRTTPKAATALEACELPMSGRQAIILAIVTGRGPGGTALSDLVRYVRKEVDAAVPDYRITKDIVELELEGYLVVFQ